MEWRNKTGSFAIARTVVSACVCVLLECTAALAYPDLDWKMYDGGSGVGDTTLCFYEEHTIDRTHRGVVRAWTKCLAQSRLDAAGSDHLKATYSRAMIDLLADRRTYGYVLPILSAETLGRKEASAAVKYEAVADLAGAAPETMTLYEVACRSRRERLIKGTLDGKSVQPSGWKSPSSKGSARLRQLLCR
jgi:hypothetical protein